MSPNPGHVISVTKNGVLWHEGCRGVAWVVEAFVVGGMRGGADPDARHAAADICG